MSAVLAIAWVALKRFMRDRSNVFFVLVFPIGLILIFGLSFGGESESRVGLVTGDGEIAGRIAAAVESSAGVAVVRVEDEPTLRARVERGELVAGLVVPADLVANLQEGEAAEVTFLATQGGAAGSLRFVLAAALGSVTERLRAAVFAASRTDDPVEVTLREVDELATAARSGGVTGEWLGESTFGDDVGTFDVSAGSQLVLFMFLTGVTSSAALIQSRRLGVSKRTLAAPVGSLQVVLGEALGFLGVSVFQGLYIVAATAVLFGVDWGDPLGVAVLLVVFACVSAATGMLFGALFRNDQQAIGVSIFAGLGLAALGGAMVPLELFGDGMRAAARAIPHSWAVDGFALLLRHGASVVDVLPHVGVLAAFTVLLFALAAWRFRVTLLRS
ncbi:MAG TPA: ABC transporter permease [Trueperaceae bacterium]|nr:ABC transporter permease [Trueperaceae bacterium]